MPVVPGIAFPTIEQVLILARAHLNDTYAGATNTPGEGLIFTDDNPSVLPFLNDAIADFQRELHDNSIETLVAETFILNIPPVNGPLGMGVPDPTVQQNLNYSGFFDGNSNTSTIMLPSDCLVPDEVWQRLNGSGQPFSRVAGPTRLLSSYQGLSLGNWEWRGDAIYWNGSLVAMDIRLRYTRTVSFFASTTPVSSFPSTSIPLADSLTCLGLGCAIKFSAARTQPGATAELQAKWQNAMDGVVTRAVKGQQNCSDAQEAYGGPNDWVYY